MPIVIAVVALCVIILIHELGHFGAARLFNMKVYQFNLGMGPILLKRKRGETQYALRLFPIGGSCMLGEDEDPGDDPREFRNNAVWKKMIVIAAGAFLNMVLGLVLAIIISIASPIASLTIADFPGASPISNTGASALMEDDTIVSVNGMRVFANPEIAYKMDNTLMRSAREGGGANVSEHSMTVSIFGYGSMSNTGEYALQPDDRIVSIGGVEITSAQHIYEQLQQIVNSGAVLTHEREEADGSVTVINYVEAEMLVNRGSLEGLPVTLSAVKIPFRESGESRVLLRDFFVKAVYEFVVIRNGEKITLPEVVFAAAPNERGGISYVRDFRVWAAEKTFGNVMSYSFRESVGMARIIWLSLSDILRGTYGLNDLSGPIGIGGVVSDAAQHAEDFGELVMMIVQIAAFITINLGIVNLLPIPALDGARLVFLGVEGVRRKPLDPNVEGIIHFVGFALLMVLLVVITFNDIRQMVS